MATRTVTISDKSGQIIEGDVDRAQLVVPAAYSATGRKQTITADLTEAELGYFEAAVAKANVAHGEALARIAERYMGKTLKNANGDEGDGEVNTEVDSEESADLDESSALNDDAEADEGAESGEVADAEGQSSWS